MDRLRSPLLAIVALLVFVGPLAGRISQSDTHDPYQISTPSPGSTGSAPDSADAPEATLSWSFNHEGITGDEARTLIHGVGYLLRAPQRLMLIDTRTLEPIWDREYDTPIDSVTLAEKFAPSDTTVLFAHSGYTVFMIDIETGDAMWTYEAPGGGISWMVHGDNLVRRHHHMASGSVFVVDMSTGEDIWSASGTSRTADYVAVGSDSIAVLENETLTMYELDSGDVLWSTTNAAVYAMHYQDDTFILMDENSVTGLDTRSGNQAWSTSLTGTKRLITDRYGYLIIETPGEAVSVSSKNGDIAWRVPLGTPDDTAEDVSGSNMLGRVSLSDGMSVVYSGVTGELLLHLDDAYPGDVFGPNHTLFQVDLTLYITDDEAGTVVHEMTIPGDASTIQAEFAGNWLVYQLDEELKALNLETGEDHLIKSSTALLGWSMIVHRSVVIVLTEAGTEIYSLESGELVTTLALSDFVRLFEQDDIFFLYDGDTVIGFDLESQEVLFQRDALGLHVGGLDDGTSLWAATNDDLEMTVLQAWDTAGNERWSYTPVNPLSIAGVFENGNTQEVWVSDEDFIYVLNGETGDMRMRVPIVEGIHYTSTVFRPDAMLMFDGQTTYVYSEP